jgi:hypothetical protein
MTDPMTGAVHRLMRAYPIALMAYQAHPDEQHLHSAYDLGRTALADGISLLELTRIHHAAAGPILLTATPADLPATLEAAAAFQVEAISAYDMARSGFLEQAGINPADDQTGRP